MMELKTYQLRVLDAFSRWCEVLKDAQNKSDAAVETLKEQEVDISVINEARNYPKTAWNRLKQSREVAASAGDYVPRTDDANRPIPHICFKVPTGGGKTLLAAAALERLHQQTGLVLWIVPSKAIYTQTKAALWNKEHPYRQMLERASARRVKMLEKDDPFNQADIANYLCVMLLMLPAANRQKGKEFLRMFKDSGRYPSFFGDGDDLLSDGRLMETYPDLECNVEGGTIKHSLYNVLKIVRPVVILDEAHKAYGSANPATNEEFARSINRLDPQLVIELSATPNHGISNLLVDIEGPDLRKEEMIKLPVQVSSFSKADWGSTLEEAVTQLEQLEKEAKAFETQTGRYIRPIAVVRVELTGKEQINSERVHAEHVRAYLIEKMHVPPEAIRVKSAENDELGREDLLCPFSEVRWIITRSALMEGWDCPFAYLLVMLDNTQAQKAITQLVGRVMRQPHAQLTGQELLDQCYVYCNNTEVGTAVEQVKQGLESEGLTGLSNEVISPMDVVDNPQQRQKVSRSKPFQKVEIFLPKVRHKKGDDWVDLDYESHILTHINWSAIEPPKSLDIDTLRTDEAIRQDATVGDGMRPAFHDAQALDVDKAFKVSDLVRHLSSILPNLWDAGRIVMQLYERLQAEGKTDEEIYDRRPQLIYYLREHVKAEVEKQAEQVFLDKLQRREIRFDLEAGQSNYRIPQKYDISVQSDEPLFRKNYDHMQLSLFAPVFREQFDTGLERKFACYLDEQKALRWWHRVAVRQQGGFYLQGWKPERIYPDFVAMASNEHLYLFETKGEDRRDSTDTVYKQKVLKALEGAFNSVGQVTLGYGGTFEMVFNEDEFPKIS